MTNIAVLGSTGSIGQNALEVIGHFPDRFHAAALTADSNIDLLSKQIKQHNPYFVCVTTKKVALKLKKIIKGRVKVFVGEDGLENIIADKKIDKLLLAISGSAGLFPLLKSLEYEKQVALANKEALVMAGPIIMDIAKRKDVKIIPIDSEQSAIWQCLEGEDKSALKQIYLTASGGPFRKMSQKDLKNVSIKKVLKHPRWKMGKKISVDSANLMNKGLELMEAMFLFGMPHNKIKILIHPEAIIHSMVEFIDGVIMAQMSVTDMRIPIQYALSYPKRLTGQLPSVDFKKLGKLHFQEPQPKKFPCLRLAYRAASGLGTMPTVLNAANEVCVEEFLKERLRFIYIPRVIEKVLDKHKNRNKPSLADIMTVDNWSRREAKVIIDRLN